MGLACAQGHIQHLRADIDGKVTHAMLNHAHGPAAIIPNGCPAPICRTNPPRQPPPDPRAPA